MREPVDLLVPDLCGVTGYFYVAHQTCACGAGDCGAWMGGEDLVLLQGCVAGVFSREAAISVESCRRR